MATIIELPCFGYEQSRFDPVETKDVARMDGRRTETASFGTRFWRYSAATGHLDDDDFDAAEAFFDQVAQAGGVFKAYDYFRQRPRAYDTGPLDLVKAGGGAFTGEGAVDAVTDALTLSLSGLPANFAINKSCWIEVKMSDTVRSLHRIRTAVAANGAGQVSVSLVQPIDTNLFDETATVNFERPGCLVALDGAPAWTRERIRRSVSFQAVEVFPG